MFKKSLGIFVFLILCSPLWSVPNMEKNSQRPNRWSLTKIGAGGVSTNVVVVDFDGDFLPGTNLTNDLGASTYTWKTVYTGGIVASSGIISQNEEFISLSSADPQGFKSAGITIATNTFTWFLTFSTGTLDASTNPYNTGGSSTNYFADITQSSSNARNIIVFSSVTVGVGTTTLAGCVTFYGVDATGFSNRETIFFSTTPTYFVSSNLTSTAAFSVLPSSGPDGNTVMGSTNPARYTGIGNIAWSYISSFTITLTSVTDTLSNVNVTINIGWGDKFGIDANLTSSSDVYKVTVNGRDKTFNPSTQIDVKNNTIVFPWQNTNPAPGPNGGETAAIWYRIRKSPQQ